LSNIVHKKIGSKLKFVYSANDTLSVIFQNNNLLLGVVGEFILRKINTDGKREFDPAIGLACAAFN